jgi:hypothetical protein
LDGEKRMMKNIGFPEIHGVHTGEMEDISESKCIEIITP